MLLLDSNVFINASRLYYAPDIAPTFWDWLTDQHLRGNIASIRRVRDEINDGKAGHLTTWAAALPSTFWLIPGSSTANSLTQLASWTMDPSRLYTPAAKNEFLSVADYYLVAQAHDLGHEIVTFEKSEPGAKKRITIPDACIAMGVRYRRPFDVYRKLGLRFH